MKTEIASASRALLTVSGIGLVLVAAPDAGSAEFKAGDVAITLRATATYGVATRAEDRNPAFLSSANATAIGLTGTAPAGRNSDDGNMNYAKGDVVSNVLKAVIDLEAKQGKFGALLRAKAWKDFTLENESVPWGHLPNGYAAGRPLSDASFRSLSKFSGVAILDANAYGTFEVRGMPLEARVGLQSLGWGERSAIGGGLSGLNPNDNLAQLRPGAVRQEWRLPFGAVFGKLEISSDLSAEAFYQFAWRRTEVIPCGVFFSTNDFVAPGCDRVMVGPGNDRQSIATGSVVKRADDVLPSDSGQFGLGVTMKLKDLRSEAGVYYANYHSRTGYYGAIKASNASGAPVIPGDPAARNAQYYVEFPEDVHLFGLTWLTRLGDLTLVGEATYRSNQPFQLSGVDLLNAFASNTAATPLRADAQATAPGGAYSGYDSRHFTQVQLGAQRIFKSALGAQGVTLGAEVGLKYANDLPDPNQRRYGRSTLYGAGPVGGVCPAGAPDFQCTNDGFVSKSSWGFRVRASATYPNVFTGVTLVPSIFLGHDVKGWSHDLVFVEGRTLYQTALRIEIGKTSFANLGWVGSSGGTYNNFKDRDYFVFSIGANL